MTTKDNAGKAMQAQVIEKKLSYEGFLSISKVQVEHDNFDGGARTRVTRELMERGHAVAVLMYDPMLDVVGRIEHFRIGASESDNPWLLEVVAGVIEPGEKPEEVARREAEEESGAIVGDMTHITTYYGSAGGSTEQTHVYYAEIDAATVEGVHGLDSEGEDIRVHKLGSADLFARLNAGQLNTASLQIAAQWLESKMLKAHKQN